MARAPGCRQRTVCRRNECPECRLGCSEGTVSAHPRQVWLCLCPGPSASTQAGGLAFHQADYGNCPSLKYLPSPLKVLLTAFLVFFFLYLFKEPCNFFFFLSFYPPFLFLSCPLCPPELFEIGSLPTDTKLILCVSLLLIPLWQQMLKFCILLSARCPFL